MPKVQTRNVFAWISILVLTATLNWSATSIFADDPAASGASPSSAPPLPIPSSPPAAPSSPAPAQGASKSDPTSGKHSLPTVDSRTVLPGEQVIQIKSSHSKVNLRNLDSRVLELGNRIKIVDGFDADKIAVKALSPHRIRIHAENPGVTTVKLIDEFDNVHVVDVFVEPDTRELEAYLQRLFPKSAIEVIGVRDGVVLRGWVTEAVHIPQIMDIAEQFYEIVHPQLTVAGPSQVQLQVKVLEVQRSKLRELGINFDISGSHFLFGSSVGALIPETAEFNLSIFGNDGEFNAFIEALVTDSLAKVLAEPILVTNSGRPASMLSGGKFPFPVPQSLGTNTIQWERYGVSLEAVPIVLGEGRLRLDLAPEVSEQDFSRATEVNGQTVPALSVRSVNTQVEMRFGETLMIGGLISSRRVASNRKAPIIGDMPVIGALFSRKRYEMAETELVVLVTPQMVAPMAPHQVPCGGPGLQTTDPVDRELYLDGLLEVPNYGPECPNCPQGGMGYPAMPSQPMMNVPPAMDTMQPTPVDHHLPHLGSAVNTDSNVVPASGTTQAAEDGRRTVINPFHLVRPSAKETVPGPAAETSAAVEESRSPIQRASATVTRPQVNVPKPRTPIFGSGSLPGLITPKSSTSNTSANE